MLQLCSSKTRLGIMPQNYRTPQAPAGYHLQGPKIRTEAVIVVPDPGNDGPIQTKKGQPTIIVKQAHLSCG